MIVLARNVLHALLIGLWVSVEPVSAETIPVRSGEHGDFSRLVLDLTTPYSWAFGRSDNGYELRLHASEVTFDLTDVFRLIGRQRISDLVDSASGTGLEIVLDCSCNAKAFATASGAVVIDVFDGAADPDSPFEQRLPQLDPHGANAMIESQDKQTAAEPLLQMQAYLAPTSSEDAAKDAHFEVPAMAERATPAAPRTSGYLGRSLPDKQLEFFWGGVAPGGALPEAPVSESLTADYSGRSVPNPDMSDEHVSSVEAGVSPRETGLDGQEANSEALNLPLMDNSRTELAPLEQLPFPDRRLAQTEVELFRQLGRAAAQGLIEVDRFDKPGPSRRVKGQAHMSPEKAPQEADDRPVTDSGPRANIQSETSVDRDMLAGNLRNPMTGNGLVCLPDSAFAVSSWGDDRPIGVQIAEKRARLVGEFDRPNPDLVLDLARLYLYFGFGVEAQAVFRAFPEAKTEEAPLDEIALILDNRHPSKSGVLSAMTECDTAAALWALLAQKEVLPGTTINAAAVNRAFSGLPLHLRKLLGPDVSERLLKLDHADAASSIRNAIARADTDGESELRMIDAQIALASSHPELAENQLEPVALSNSPDAPQALILAIESKLDRSEAVSPALTESAGAMAYELRHAPIGAQLERAHILSLASVSDFVAAFDALREWRKRGQNDLQGATFVSLLQSVTKRGDDQVFMTEITAHLDDPFMILTGMELKLDAADRMGALGFSDLPRKLLEGEPGHTLRGRRLAARLSLADYDPQRALEIVSGLRDAEAMRLQADALAMMGEHLSAADRFAQTGEVAASARQSWQGGDYAAAATHAPQEIGQAIASLGLDTETETTGTGDTGGVETASQATDPAGQLSEARYLIEDSQSARQAIADLFAYSSPAETAE
jgi:hypothetical protein